MHDRTRSFLADETGAVTVEWVVLTAGIVTLALAVVLTVRDGVTDLGTEIRDKAEAVVVNSPLSN